MKRPREVIRRGIALHVLEPEDIHACGGPETDGEILLSKLENEGFLSVPARDALAKLVELRPGTSSEPVAKTARVAPKPALPKGGLNLGKATLAPSRDDEDAPPPSSASLNLGAGTLAPERDDDRPSPSLNVASGTMAPERDDKGSAPRSGLNLASGTLAPERDDPAPRGGGLNLASGTNAPDRDDPAPRGGGLIGNSNTMAPARDEDAPSEFAAASGTMAPERDDAPVKSGLNLQSGTLAPERDDDIRGEVTMKMEEFKTPSSATLNVGKGTMAPERDDAPAPAPAAAPGKKQRLNVEAGTVAPDEDRPKVGTLAPAGDADMLVDLDVLDPASRQAIEEASFARIAVRLGLITRDLVREAKSTNPEGRIEDILVQRGLIDPPSAMEIFGLRQTTRPVCQECLGLLPQGQGPGTPCPLCGAVSAETGTGSSGPPRSGGTIVGREASRGIEGFPGEGGTFAGYELLERVAEGGMGVVFRARQTKLNRIVALKVMRGGSLASKSRKRRFLQEAEAAAALKHPYIVPVHEIDEVSGYPFYTMDFVDGKPMDRWVLDRKPSPQDVSTLMRKVADAVQHFHLNGIIHRDLKPDNVLVTEDAQPRIIDFGIAKKMGHETDSGTLEGDVLGTPHYMSPEQAAGRVREVDTRTDVYALGTILYELLTGAPPWKDLSQARLVVAIQEDDPPAMRLKNPEIESDLEAIVQKAMSKERERRYQSALELAEDLGNYVAHLPIKARPATFFYRLKKTIRRRLPVFIAAGVVLLAVTGAGIYLGIEARKKAEEAKRAHDEVMEMLAFAQTKTNAIDARLDKAKAAKVKEPENGEAQAIIELINAEKGKAAFEADQEAKRKEAVRAAEEKARLDKAEADRKAAEAEAARLKIEGQAEAEKQQALKARKEAEDGASKLLAQATAAQDPNDAFDFLNDARAVCPKDSPVREKIELGIVELSLQLAKAAVSGNESGTAKRWLKQAERYEAKKQRESEIAAVKKDLELLASGQRDLDEARKLKLAGQLVEARKMLEKRVAEGGASAEVQKELVLVRESCADRTNTIVAEGVSLLGKGDPKAAKARANEALVFDPRSESAKQLMLDAEQDIARAASKEAEEQFAQNPRAALVTLENAARNLQDVATVTSLKRELAARQRLAENRALLEKMVFVPEIPELTIASFYVAKTEVTNGEFKEFVEKGGYANQSFWDDEGWKLVPTFRDGCPGGTCTHKAPRGWVGDSFFGDTANADRPVRGITIHEARAFARWKSSATSQKWRLPTDKEWEVAAGWDPAKRRVQSYPWGDSFDANKLVLKSELPFTVGTKADDRSPLGALDMGGNVAEWVERPGGLPATKGAFFDMDAAHARRWALVRQTGNPGSQAPVEFVARTGFRLALDVD